MGVLQLPLLFLTKIVSIIMHLIIHILIHLLTYIGKGVEDTLVDRHLHNIYESTKCTLYNNTLHTYQYTQYNSHM